MRPVAACLVAAALVASVHAAGAQQIMDRSDELMSQEAVAVIRRAIGEGQRDPYGTQIDRLRYVLDAERNPVFCGRVNYRGDDGLLLGFVPFALPSTTLELATGSNAVDRGC